MGEADRAARIVEIALWTAFLVAFGTGTALLGRSGPSPDDAFASVEAIRRSVEGDWVLRLLHDHATSLFFQFLYAHFLLRLLLEPQGLALRAGGSLIGLAGALALIAGFSGFVLPLSAQGYWHAAVAGALLWPSTPLDPAILPPAYLNGHLAAGLGVLAVGVARLAVLAPHVARRPIEALAAAAAVPALLALPLLGAIASLQSLSGVTTENGLATPAHIVPEWYFLPFYSVLRAFPSKEAGVAAMGAAMLGLIVAPWFGFGAARPGLASRILRAVFAMLFFAAALGLLVLGSQFPDRMLFDDWRVIDASFALAAFAFSYLYGVRPLIGLVEILLERSVRARTK